MPTCEKCACEFPAQLIEDGVVRDLRHRRRCLRCYPSNGQVVVETKTCGECGLKLKRHGRALSDKRDFFCPNCRVQRSRRALKRRAIESLGGACAFCGYNRCARSLHFHHRDPSQKDFVIAGKQRWTQIERELRKCVLVCSNCHGELHEGILSLDAVAVPVG